MPFEDDEIASDLNLDSRDREAHDASSRTVVQPLTVHGALAISPISSHDKATPQEKRWPLTPKSARPSDTLMANHKITHRQARDLLRFVAQHTHASSTTSPKTWRPSRWTCGSTAAS